MITVAKCSATRSANAAMTPTRRRRSLRALLRHIQLPHRLWDPGCGYGTGILDPLRAAGHEVIGSDLIDHARPDIFSRRDFLMERKAPDGCEGIVTNPPFKLAGKFVAHALDLCPLVICWSAMMSNLLILACQGWGDRNPGD